MRGKSADQNLVGTETKKVQEATQEAVVRKEDLKTDLRFLKLCEYHKQERAYSYGLGGHKEKKDYSRNNLMYAPFYDGSEPDWVKPICGSIRMQAYEDLVYRGWGVLGSPALHMEMACIGYGASAPVLSVAICLASKLFPKSYEWIKYCMLALINIPAIGYICNDFYKGAQEARAIERRVEYYKDRSIEHILSEAYNLGLGNIRSMYTPGVIRVASLPSDNKASVERS